MISDHAIELEKQQAVREQNELIINSLVGNCYQYKDHNDKYFTYVRIIKTQPDMSLGNYATGYQYRKEVDYPIQIHPLISLDAIKNMTQITLEEFMYNTSQYLKLHDLQFIPGKLDT